MIGRIIGTYKIEEKIGEGGMGAVYRGVDQMLQRTVAVKVLRPELAQQPRVLERFRSEAITLARLNHPNIATLYSFLQDQDEYFMILEFVQGQTFENLLRRGAMSYEEAIPLFCQALDGIAHAHGHGIVHRDIKPANVMLTDAGSVKVMDFGIARVLGTARMTRTGHLIGTIEYMSPEQVRGQETDARSDIYSLGVLLYEMLTGRVPFEADSDFELMQAHVKKTPRSLRAFRPSVPSAVEKAVLRALAKKPTARFPDVVTFRDTLDGALRAAVVSAGGGPEAGRGLAWFRQLFTTAGASSSTAAGATSPTEAATKTQLVETPQPEAAPESPPVEAAPATRLAEAVPATRLAEAKETRLAPEAAAGAPAAPPPRLPVPRRTPPWKYALVVVPLLLTVVAFLVWQSDSMSSGPAGPDPDSLTVARVDTTETVPVVPAPVVPEVLPEQLEARDQPRLLSPEEFAGTNPSPEQPANVPETKSVTPRETPPGEPERATDEDMAEEPEAPRTGTVHVIVRPFGDVFVDGRRKASGTNQPYVEEVAEGTYRVRAVHPRFGRWEKLVSVRPGKTEEVVFNFNREHTVTVTSQPPNAEIVLDGKSTRRYTPSVLTVRPGQHRISVRKRGYDTAGGPRKLTIERDASEPVHFVLNRKD